VAHTSSRTENIPGGRLPSIRSQTTWEREEGGSHTWLLK
jgi:hypothetical protein